MGDAVVCVHDVTQTQRCSFGADVIKHKTDSSYKTAGYYEHSHPLFMKSHVFDVHSKTTTLLEHYFLRRRDNVVWDRFFIPKAGTGLKGDVFLFLGLDLGKTLRLKLPNMSLIADF